MSKTNYKKRIGILLMTIPIILMGQVDSNINNFRFSGQQKPLNTSDEGFGFYEFTPYKGFNTPYSSVSDSEGNLYVTGSSSNEQKATSDFLTIKISPEGKLLWESRSNTTDFVVEMGMIITLDEDENPVVAGSTWNGHDMDIETVKYDKFGGERTWTSVWDGNAGGLDTPVDIAVDSDGNIIVAGYSYQNNPERNEFTTIKINSDGEILWSVIDNFEEQGLSFFPSSVAVANNGNIAIAGYGWQLFNNQSEGYQTYYTIQYSSDGNELWKDNYLLEAEADNGETIKTNSSIRDIEFDQHGNCYVLGSYAAPGIPSTIGIVKYKEDGEREWLQTYQKDENWTKGQVLKITDNALYVTGRYYDSINTDGVVLVAYAFDGTQKWQGQLDGFMELMDRNTYLTIGHDNLPVFCGFGLSYEGDAIRVKVAKYTENGSVINSNEYNPEIQSFRDITNISTNQEGNVYLSLASERASQGTVFEGVKLDINAQNNPLVWNYIYSNQGSTNGYPSNSVCDENGNTYVLNTYHTISPNNELLDNFYIIKYSSENIIEWVKDVETLNSSKCLINIDSLGEVIITLYPLYEQQGNLLIKKYSANGENLWTKEKQLNAASINSVITDEDGNIFLAGSAKENTDTNDSFLLAKFSNEGEEIWTKYINSGNDAHNIFSFSKIGFSSNQNIIAIGNYGYGNFWTGAITDMAVLQIDGQGNLDWWATVPSEDTFSNASDFYTDIDDDIYIVGEESQMPLLVKISAEGEIEWQKTYAEPERQVAFNSIEPFSNGNFIVSASSSGGGIDPTSGMPYNRIALIEYSAEGEEQNVVHTEAKRYYKEMYVDSQDNVYLLNKIETTPLPYREPYWIGPLNQAGLFILDADGNTNELIFEGPNVSQYEPVSLSPHSDGRLLIMGRLFHEYGTYAFSGTYLFETTHETLGVDDNIFQNAEVNFLGQNYPNPVSTSYTTIPFKVKETGQVSIDLYDASGKHIRNLFSSNLQQGDHTITVDVSGLPEGIYFYQLSSVNFKASKKMIINN